MPKVVDFPLPLGPKMPYTLPFSIEKERLSTAVRLPNFLVRFSIVRIVSKSKYVLVSFLFDEFACLLLHLLKDNKDYQLL